MVDIGKLSDIYSDGDALLFAADIIARRSTNRFDIREQALAHLPLRDCQVILEIGCGFGYFTRALKGKVHSGARILGIDTCSSYKNKFLASATQAGLTAEFRSVDVAALDRFPVQRYDLIISSYAMYFFPEAVPIIARLLKKSGIFVAITHAVPHMEELGEIMKQCLFEKSGKQVYRLPEEDLFERFSDQNAKKLLEPWFGTVSEIIHRNSLKFDQESFGDLIHYIRFKRPFFLAEDLTAQQELMDRFEQCLIQLLGNDREFTITKNDVIYIGENPQPV